MPRFSLLIPLLPLLLAACTRPAATTAAKPPVVASSIDIFPLSDNRLGFTAPAGRIVCENKAKVEVGLPNTCACSTGGMKYFITSKDDMTFIACSPWPFPTKPKP